MANAFAPEIGFDIGASNVTPGSARSIDFSGLANLANVFAGSSRSSSENKPSEKEIENVMMEPFIQDLNAISQIENLLVREAQFRLAESRAYQMIGSGYREDIKALVDSYKGISTPPATTEAGADQLLLQEYAKTTEGQLDAIRGQEISRNPDGSVNPDKLYSFLVQRAHDKARSDQKYNDLKRRVETREFNVKDVFPEFMAEETTKANEYFTNLQSTNAIISQAFDRTKNTTENTLQAKGLLQQEIDSYKAKVTARANALGINTNEGPYKIDSVFALAESKLKIMENILTYPETAAKELTEATFSGVVRTVNEIDPVTAMALTTNEGKAAFVNSYISKPGVLEEMRKSAEAAKSVANTLNPASIFLPTAPANGSVEMTPPPVISPRDQSTAGANASLSEFNPAFVQTYRTMDPAKQKEELTKNNKAISLVNPNDITDTQSAASLMHMHLTPKYLMLASRAPTDFADMNFLQDSYGSKSFEFAKKMSTVSPSDGMLLYKQINKAMSSEVSRISVKMRQEFSTMFPPDKNPFVIKELNGRLVIGLDEAAVREDRDIKEIVDKMSLQAGAAPEMRDLYPAFEENKDPNFEDLRTSLFFQTYNPPFLLENIKQLNFLYTQFNQMPEEVKNNPAYGRIILLDAINNLPKYKSEMGTSE